jgi:tetraacyldisaccharide 4'-kinase
MAYRGVNRVRRSLYRRGILRSEALPRPVISVGNRAIGGSGKTPAVIAIARGLSAAGKRVAILTRGYGRSETAEPLRVDRSDPARFGDEPSVIHEELPGVPVIVGARRARAARWFLERGECDVFLLDDGFQHIQLARDIDVVIENAEARRFREGESALAEADVVLLRNGARFAGAAPAFRADLEPVEWVSAGGPRPLEELRGKRAVAFAGLADNAQFFRMLESLGVELRESISFRDHQRYGEGELRRIEETRRAAGAELVLTTMKDRVKARARDFAALRVEMKLEPAFFALLLARVGGA